MNYIYQPAHPHAVTVAGGTYTYDANGNTLAPRSGRRDGGHAGARRPGASAGVITRPVNGVTYTLGYDAEGRMVTVSGGSYNGVFTYDGDGKRVKSTINSVSTIFVGNYYEKAGSTITKYYYAPPPPSACFAIPQMRP